MEILPGAHELFRSFSWHRKNESESPGKMSGNLKYITLPQVILMSMHNGERPVNYRVEAVTQGSVGGPLAQASASFSVWLLTLPWVPSRNRCSCRYLLKNQLLSHSLWSSNSDLFIVLHIYHAGFHLHPCYFSSVIHTLLSTIWDDSSSVLWRYNGAWRGLYTDQIYVSIHVMFPIKMSFLFPHLHVFSHCTALSTQ